MDPEPARRADPPIGALAVRLQSTAATITWEAPDRRVTDIGLDFSVFFRAEFGAVFRTVSLMLRNKPDPKKITQDAFIELLKNWPKSPATIARKHGSAVSQFGSPMRAIRRDRLWALARLKLAPADSTPGPSLDVADAIARLSSSQRAAIVLHYYEDLPVVEIAAILGCAEPTAHVHLHRARQRLRELLGEGPDVV